MKANLVSNQEKLKIQTESNLLDTFNKKFAKFDYESRIELLENQIRGLTNTIEKNQNEYLDELSHLSRSSALQETKIKAIEVKIASSDKSLEQKFEGVRTDVEKLLQINKETDSKIQLIDNEIVKKVNKSVFEKSLSAIKSSVENYLKESFKCYSIGN